jgi:hypothetical protein
MIRILAEFDNKGSNDFYMIFIDFPLFMFQSHALYARISKRDCTHIQKMYVENKNRHYVHSLDNFSATV